MNKFFLYFTILIFVQISSALNATPMILKSTNMTDLGYDGFGVTICIIDTGVDYEHQNLGSCSYEQFISGGCPTIIGGFNFINNNDNPLDGNGHGTAISGLILSDHSTYRGIAPGAKIVSLKSLTDEKILLNESNLTAALSWCINNATRFNISIISISFSGANEAETQDACSNFSNTKELINEAVSHGIIVFAA